MKSKDLTPVVVILVIVGWFGLDYLAQRRNLLEDLEYSVARLTYGLDKESAVDTLESWTVRDSGFRFAVEESALVVYNTSFDGDLVNDVARRFTDDTVYLWWTLKPVVEKKSWKGEIPSWGDARKDLRNAGFDRILFKNDAESWVFHLSP